MPLSSTSLHSETLHWDSSGNWTACASLDFSGPHACFYFRVQRTTFRQIWCPEDPWGAMIDSLPLLLLCLKACFRKRCDVVVFVTTDMSWGRYHHETIWYRVAWDVPKPSGNYGMSQTVPWNRPGFREIKGDLKPRLFSCDPTAKWGTDLNWQSQTCSWR